MSLVWGSFKLLRQISRCNILIYIHSFFSFIVINKGSGRRGEGGGGEENVVLFITVFVADVKYFRR